MQKETQEEITAQLKETLEQMPHLKEIHFDAKGNHYFNVHEHEGEKYARIRPKSSKGEGKDRVNFPAVPFEETKIVETKTREEILGIAPAEEKKSKKGK